MTLVTNRRIFFAARLAGVALPAAAVLGGAILVHATASLAQDRPGERLLRGGSTTVPEPPDWIRKTRPPEAVLYNRDNAVAPAEPQGEPMSAERLRKLEAEMNALRRRHERATGLRPAPAGRTAAAAPRKKKQNSGQTCVLTCNIGLGRTRGK
jgi:hypothetical protein